ncbi:MAG: hypothetical protein K8I60_06015 [Anaerolineae bacterium]|nr:hypothetical protein [Anaerolineae bacterium]
MMRPVIALWSVLVFILAACGGQQADSGPAYTDPIEWDHRADAIVFRADVEGGDTARNFTSLSEIPLCTIYGDNRVVWTNDLGAFTTQVLWDKLTDDQMRVFISQLTINAEFFKYEARANLEPPSAETPVVETLMLRVNGVERKSDSFSGWEPNYYENVLGMCAGVSRAPVLYAPDGAWVSAQTVPYDINAPLVMWDGNAAGLKLIDLAGIGQPTWISGGVLPYLWQVLHSSPPNLQFNENEVYYNIALQIPNVTRTSPPAPSN